MLWNRNLIKHHQLYIDPRFEKKIQLKSKFLLAPTLPVLQNELSCSLSLTGVREDCSMLISRAKLWVSIWITTFVIWCEVALTSVTFSFYGTPAVVPRRYPSLPSACYVSWSQRMIWSAFLRAYAISNGFVRTYAYWHGFFSEPMPFGMGFRLT